MKHTVIAVLCAGLLVACDRTFAPVEPLPASQLDRHVRALAQVHQELVRAAPGDARAHGELGLVYATNGHLREALQSYDQAAALTDDPVWAHRAALATLALGDRERALQRFEAQRDAYPDYAPSLYRLADLLLEAGDQKSAEELYRETMRLSPGTPACFYGLARALLQRRAYAEARDLLQSALRLRPGDPSAYVLLASAHRGLGNAEEARRAAARGREAPARHLADAFDGRTAPYVAAVAPLLETARELRRDGRSDEALELLQRGRQMHGDDRYLVHDLALTLIATGRSEEARDVLARGLERTPDDPRLLVKLGESWIASGEPLQALEPAREATRVDPQHGPGHFLEGRALMFLENYGEAYLALRDAEAIDTDPQIDLALAEACKQLNLPLEAEKHLTEAAAFLPDALALHCDLTSVRLDLGDLDGARDALNEARLLAPGSERVGALERRLARESEDATAADASNGDTQE